MSENPAGTNAPDTAEESAEATAARAMNELMADNTALLTDYLRVTAARITAERKAEDLAREQWTAWRALTSSKKGGFSETQLKRQSITAPAPVPRRDRGKKRTKRTTQRTDDTATPTSAATPAAPHAAPQADNTHQRPEGATLQPDTTQQPGS